MRGLVRLCLAVLSAIGLGVAAEAATGAAGPTGVPAAAVYGTPSARFVAAFPRPPRRLVASGAGVVAVDYLARTGATSYEVRLLRIGPAAAAPVRRMLASGNPEVGLGDPGYARLVRGLSERACALVGACGVWVGYAPLEHPLEGWRSRALAGRHARVLLVAGAAAAPGAHREPAGHQVELGTASVVVGHTLLLATAEGDRAPVEAFLRSFRPLR